MCRFGRVCAGLTMEGGKSKIESKSRSQRDLLIVSGQVGWSLTALSSAQCQTLQDGCQFPPRLALDAANFLTLSRALTKLVEVQGKKLKLNIKVKDRAITYIQSPTAEKNVKVDLKSLLILMMERNYTLWHHSDELICLVQRHLARVEEQGWSSPSSTLPQQRQRLICGSGDETLSSTVAMGSWWWCNFMDL
ncbi:unnamed protein product [Lupinus luteus]|uniref:Uncharacterized protein n=1 Tax=Lupinus luteus TaxID=3873 RepID=A0AAV1XW30_LUPLU